MSAPSVRARGLLGGVAAALFLAGCTPAPAPTPTLPVPPGVSVAVVQNRLYIARGEASLDVTNGGAEDVSLAGLGYRTPSLAGAIDWSGVQVIPAGATRSIRFTVPDAACDGDPTAGGTASLSFTTAAGTATADFAVTDPFGFLASHAATGCFARTLAADASIALAGVATRQTAAGTVAVLALAVTVTGTSAVRIDAAKGTTLLQPAAGGYQWQPAATIEAGRTATVELEAAPARCDLHAIGEDKVGTRFDTTVTILGATPTTGTITLVATDAQRGALFDFVTASCGTAG